MFLPRSVVPPLKFGHQMAPLALITNLATRWPEMEKRADGADASVLFFLLGCANFLAVYVQIR